MQTESTPTRRLTLCGTRKVIEKRPGDYRIICATCDGGGTVSYPSADLAGQACVKQSARKCTICGAE